MGDETMKIITEQIPALDLNELSLTELDIYETIFFKNWQKCKKIIEYKKLINGVDEK